MHLHVRRDERIVSGSCNRADKVDDLQHLTTLPSESKSVSEENYLYRCQPLRCNTLVSRPPACECASFKTNHVIVPAKNNDDTDHHELGH